MDVALCLYRYRPFGGLERNFRAVAEELLARGHRVRALARSFDGPLPEALELLPLPVRAWSNAGRDRDFARAVEAVLAQRPAEVVLGFNRLPHLDLFYAADPCWAAARAERHVLRRHGRRQRQWSTWEHALFAPDGHTHALLLTERERDAYRAHYDTPPERLHVVPPSLEARFCEPPLERDASRRALGLEPSERVLLQLGSDFQRKGLDRTLRALGALPSALRRGTTLLVAGRGSARVFGALAARRAGGVRVHFLGPVADPRPLYAAADLLVHPAREENTGGVLLEALAQGLAVLCTGKPGFAEHVERSGGGLVLPEPFHPAALADALESLLSDEQGRQARARAARAYALGAALQGRAQAIADLIERHRHPRARSGA